MPGSNTPGPPGAHSQCWPGCQRCTSSRQVTVPALTTRSASHARASDTIGAKRECQPVNKVLPIRSASFASAANSVGVAAGGFSSNTCSPAAMASCAIRARTCGGVHRAIASIFIPDANRACKLSKLAKPGRPPFGSTLATSVNRESAAIAGRCWSVAILPRPTMAMEYGVVMSYSPKISLRAIPFILYIRYCK